MCSFLVPQYNTIIFSEADAQKRHRQNTIKTKTPRRLRITPQEVYGQLHACYDKLEHAHAFDRSCTRNLRTNVGDHVMIARRGVDYARQQSTSCSPSRYSERSYGRFHSSVCTCASGRFRVIEMRSDADNAVLLNCMVRWE